MTQLIVYTGFYWAVKVMENLLVVTPLCCAFTLHQHFKGASELGRNGVAQTAEAHNSWPRRRSCSLGKAGCVLLGISYHLRHASANNAPGEEGGKALHTFCKRPSRVCFELLCGWAGEKTGLEEEICVGPKCTTCFLQYNQIHLQSGGLDVGILSPPVINTGLKVVWTVTSTWPN